MQPEDRSKRSRSAMAARVRLYLKADLGWLHGYPLGVGDGGARWATTPERRTGPEDVLTLDRRALHLGTRTWSKATRRYHRALADVVSDPARWAPRVQGVLDALKPAVHDGEVPAASLLDEGWPVPVVRRARALVEQRPELGDLVDALSWSLFTTPDRLAPVLDTLEERGDQVVAAGSGLDREQRIRLQARLCWLLERHPREAPGLLAILAEAGRAPVPLVGLHRWAHELSGALKRRERRRKLPTPPRSSTHRLLDRWSADLVTRSSAERARALALVAATFPPLGAWRAAFAELRSLATRVEGLLQARPRQASRERALVSRLDELAGAAPPGVSLRRLLTLCDGASTAGYHAGALAVLRHLPDDLPPHAPACLLASWANVAEVDERALGAWLERLARWLERSPPEPARLAPWAEAWQTGLGNHWIGGPDDSVACALTAPEAHDALLECADQLAAKHPDRWNRCALEEVTSILEHAPEPLAGAEVTELVLRLGLHDRVVPWDALKVAEALATPDHPYEALVTTLCQGDPDEDPSLAEVLAPLVGREIPPLLPRILAEYDRARLARVAPALVFLVRLGHPVPEPVAPRIEPPEWVAAYPPALRPALTRLAAAKPGAERSAARLLGADLPRSAALEREIAAIESLLPGASGDRARALARRLASLKRRLETGPSPSPQRLARLQAKVERAAWLAELDRWEEDLRSSLHDTLFGELDPSRMGDWFERPHVSRSLPLLFTLEAPFRELARQLVRRRAGPPPWDWRDAPANATFLEGLSARGVEIDPWLDGFERVVELERGPVRLAVETDPAEVLYMGGHFNTCLAPGAVNYASVVANIVDVNKAVVYLRDGDGAVIGRCLLGLTREGGLVAFHPYAHRPTARLNAAVRSFVGELAQAMHTLVLARGQVPRLVAPSWYDDGPVDLSSDIEALVEGSPLRRSLPTVAPADLITRLEDALAPLSVDALTLPRILSLPEVAARPELVVPLLPAVAATDPRDETWGLALDILYRAGEHEQAARLLSRRAIPWSRGRRYLGTRVMEPLSTLLPTLALRVLHRGRGRRAPGDEPPHRSYWRAVALEALNRPHQARDCYRRFTRAAGDGPSAYLTTARERLAALEGTGPGAQLG